MVSVIGAPYDLGSAGPGSRLAPAALRLAGLLDSLERISGGAQDCGDVAVGLQTTPPAGLRSFESGLPTNLALRDRVRACVQGGEAPLVLGGDHSMALGSVCGALQAVGPELGVLWIDAHADCNTAATSPSGNLHGMTLALAAREPSGAAGVPDEQWRRLQSELVPDPGLDPARIAWIGLREVDAGEEALMSRWRESFATTIQDVDRHGMAEVVRGLEAWLAERGVRRLWVSFDVDALDPALAPGTGTIVRGGLTYREAHLLAELLHEMLARRDVSLVGLDLVEVNPLLDTSNATARMSVEWIGSLFGKRIMAHHPSVEKFVEGS